MPSLRALAAAASAGFATRALTDASCSVELGTAVARHAAAAGFTEYVAVVAAAGAIDAAGVRPALDRSTWISNALASITAWGEKVKLRVADKKAFAAGTARAPRATLADTVT